MIHIIAGLVGLWCALVPLFAFYWIVIKGADWAIHEPVKWIATTEFVMAILAGLFLVWYLGFSVKNWVRRF